MDTWSWRDGPLLKQLVLDFDASGGRFVRVTPKRYADVLALTEKDVEASMTALEHGGYLTTSTFGGGWMVEGVSGGARRLVGAWPSDDAFDRLIAALDKLIAAAPPGPERSKLETLKQAAIDVGTNVVAGLYLALVGAN